MDDLIKDIFGENENKDNAQTQEPIFENTQAPVIKDEPQEAVSAPEAQEAPEPTVYESVQNEPPQPVYNEPAPTVEETPSAPAPEIKPEPVQPVYKEPARQTFGNTQQQNQYQYQNPYTQGTDRAVFYQPPMANKQQVPNTPPVQNNNFEVPPEFNRDRTEPVNPYAYHQDNVKPAGKSGKKSKLTIVIIAIIAIAVAFAGILYAINNGNSSDTSSSKPSTSESDSSDDTVVASNDAEAEVKSSDEAEKKDQNGNLTVAGVVDSAKASCVGITVYAQQDDFSYFYNFGNNSASSNGEVKSGEGSGVIMSEADGKTYIITCAHVIEGGTRYTVTLDDDTEYEATFVGSDTQTDIGVLSIEAKGLQIAEFGNSKDIDIGEDCVAIGCPGGLEFKNSVTKGIVSALDVPIESNIGYSNECIQVDAAINPGNSGGALFNMQGQVIGINSSKIASTEYEGMGFAVPSNTAISTANSLITNGYVKGRAKLGINYATLSMLQSGGSQILAALEQKGFKDAQGTMIIGEISSESDLNGKVQKNDMIVAVNGETMTSVDVLTSVLSKSKPGDTVTLTIARIEGNNISTFEVKCKLIESKG